MTYEEARNAIQGHLDANWSATPAGTIAYDNLPFVPPSAAPWLRLSVRNAEGRQASFGGATRRYRRRGLALLQIFVPEGEGPSEAMQLGDQAVALFEGVVLSGNLRFGPVSLREIGVEDGWFQVNLAADYSFDEVK
jgi:hypothetical protein